MAMNYDNDMNLRRKLPRLSAPTMPGAGYVRRMPMPLGPSSMGSGSDVLRNFANRRGKLGPAFERPMLPSGGMMQLPSFDSMPAAPRGVRGFGDSLGAGVGDMMESYGTMDMNPPALTGVANVPAGRRRRNVQPATMIAPTRRQPNPEFTRRANELLTALDLMSGQGNFKQ